MQASQIAEWLRTEGSNFVTTRKLLAADELSKVGGAIRRAADKLTDQNSVGVARYVETAAEGVEQAARYLEERQITELLEDVSQVARQRPALFLGGVFVAGLAAARFIKAANAASATQQRPRKRRS